MTQRFFEWIFRTLNENDIESIMLNVPLRMTGEFLYENIELWVNGISVTEKKLNHFEIGVTCFR